MAEDMKQPPEFEIDKSSLEFELWNTCKLEALADGEKVQIKTRKGNLFTVATWSKEDSSFYVGWEAELKPWEVRFRQIFPDNMFERAARNYLQIINNTPSNPDEGAELVRRIDKWKQDFGRSENVTAFEIMQDCKTYIARG